MHPRLRRVFQGAQRRLNILATRPRQPRHRAVTNLARHRAHRLEISLRGDRKARLDDVHAKAFELSRQPQFFRRIHGKAGRLLAVAQRGIEDSNHLHRTPPATCEAAFEPNSPARGALAVKKSDDPLSSRPVCTSNVQFILLAPCIKGTYIAVVRVYANF